MPDCSNTRDRYPSVGEDLPGVESRMIALQGKEVYLACGFTDLRKSINGLVALVEGSFRLDPFGGAIFAFCNRSRDRLKEILRIFFFLLWLNLRVNTYIAHGEPGGSSPLKGILSPLGTQGFFQA